MKKYFRFLYTKKFNKYFTRILMVVFVCLLIISAAGFNFNLSYSQMNTLKAGQDTGGHARAYSNARP